MATYADVDAFFARWNGKSVDRDGAFGAQCVDFAAQYTAELFGVGYLPTPVTGGARDIYERFSLGQYFDKIANTPTFVPTKGDIVIWTAFSNNQFGHIAIATGEGDTNWFNSYDQNWNAQRVEKVRHNYNSVLGVLRPKALTAGVKEMAVDINNVKDLYRQLLGREANDSDAKSWVGLEWGRAYYGIKDSPEGQAFAKRRTDALNGFPVVQKQVTDLTAQVTAQQAQIDKLNAQIKELGSKPVTEDQAAQVVADTVKPSVSFIQKVINLLKGKK